MTILRYPDDFYYRTNEEFENGIIPCCLNSTRLFEGSVVVLGLFDGVHLGHRELFSRAAQIAKDRGVKLGAFTFRSTDSIKSTAERIYPDTEKLRIFSELGVDYTVIADFKSVKNLSPRLFAESVIVDAIGASVAVSGYNFRFGNKACGDASTLAYLMRELGGEAVAVDEVRLDNMTVSSTGIRRLLTLGDVKRAAAMLGAPYSVRGSVEHGDERGRELGFPTVNLHFAEGCIIPRHGVYRAEISVGEKCYTGIANVGACPTFGKRTAHLECHLFEFSDNIYGEEILVSLTDFIRGEAKFSSKAELLSQINRDIEEAKATR